MINKRYLVVMSLIAAVSACDSQRTITTAQQKVVKVYNHIPTGFENSRWQFVDIKGKSMSSGNLAPFVRFVQGELTGFTGCNNFMGRYQRDGMWLNISAFKSEKQPCDSLSAQQTLVTSALMQTRSIRVIKSTDNLVFLDGQSKVVAELKAVKMKEGS